MPPLIYANYLDLEKVLTLQNPRSTLAEHDDSKGSPRGTSWFPGSPIRIA